MGLRRLLVQPGRLSRRLFVAAGVAALLLGTGGAQALLTPTGTSFQAIAGQPFTGVVASFTDDALPLSATITWGDGSSPSSGAVTCTTCPANLPSYSVAGSHTYGQTGTYQVAVVIMDQAQQSATANSVAVVVPPSNGNGPPPVVSFTVSPAPTTGQPVAFDASGTSAANGIFGFTWQLDGPSGSPTSCGPSSFAHRTYTEPGTVRVSLTVTDAVGLSSTAARDIAVADAGALAPGVAVAGCGASTTPILAPGLRGPPSVEITSPLTLAYYDRAPSPLLVSGRVKAPEGIAAFCLTGPVSTSSIPPTCAQKSLLAKGKFADVPISGLRPGTNVVDAWVRDSVGQIAHADVVVSVATAANGIDLRADSLEVTQAVQDSTLPDKSPAAYAGVPLAEGRQTLVRFFVDAPKASSSVPVPEVANVEALLFGSRGGSALPGSPLLSEEGAQYVKKGILLPLARAKNGYKPLFTFTLPASWTKGTINLTAVVNPPDLAPAIAECLTCYGNDSFEVDKVTFTHTYPFTIVPAKLLYGSSKGLTIIPPAAEAFAATRAVMPIGDDELSIPPYATTIDLGIVEGDPDASKIALAKLYDWAIWWDYYAPASPDTFMGIHDGGIRGSTSGSPRAFFRKAGFGFTYKYIAQAGYTRPLTSITHEFGHIIGRVHASKGCGGNDDGQIGEDWPDATGTIQGVGVDTRDGGGAGVHVVHPETAIDLMSYCTSGEASAWMSTVNWRRDLGRFASPAPPGGFLATPRPTLSRAAATETLLVVGFADATGTKIVSVEPGAGPPPPAPSGPSSPYRLVARDGAGRVVSDTALAAAVSHVDQEGRAGKGQVFTFLTGHVPAAGAAAVEVVKNGAVVAKRLRSAGVPRVEVVAPRVGEVVGKGPTVRVRWRSHDADGTPLTVRVEYARSGGTRWLPVSIGPDRGSTTISSRLLGRSSHGRIRVVVSDGFNVGVGLSGAFQALGAPPEVTITSPGKGKRIAADGLLYLSGSAYDDAGKRIPGSRLRWRIGGRVLGTGALVSASGLPAGRQQIALEARDTAGRVGIATVTVRVTAVRPLFLGLRASKRLSASARQLSLPVGSTVPAKLTVAGRTFAVDRRRRVVTIPVTPGRSVLSLRLALTAAGKSSALTLRIPRR